MGLFSGIAKTVSGIAKTSLGAVSKVRSIYDFNPSLTGLLMPPQVSMGIKAAGIVGGLFGVKVPTEKDLIGFAQGKLDSVLGGIRSQIKTPLGQIEEALNAVTNGKSTLSFAQRVLSKTFDFKGLSAEQIITSIEWLL